MVDSALPIDRGWAWVILAGTFFIQMTAIGCLKAFGLIYNEFLNNFQTGAGETAWVLSLTIFMLMSCGSLSSALGKRFGFRTVIMVGGVVQCLGFAASAFVSNVLLLYLTFGVIVGLGAGLIYTPTVVMVTMYFDKRRSLANGITAAGNGIGYFLYPFLMRLLIKTYALFGTMIILGGIMLHVCVGAALMRPLQSFKTKETDENGEVATDPMQITNKKEPTHPGDENEETDIMLTDTNDTEKSTEFNEKTSIHQHESHSDELTAKSERTSCCNFMSKHLNNIYDCSYLCDPEFVLYVIAFSFANMSYSNLFMVLPPHAKDCGVGDDEIALLISLAGLSDLIGRIIFGWVSDLKFVRRKHVFIVGMVAGGGSALLAPLATSFAPLAVYACWYGLFGGSYWALVAVLLADSFGVENIPQVFGMTTTLISVPSLLSPPILGWLKDGTGSWGWSFRLAGIWMLIAGLAIMFQIIVAWFTKKRDEVSKNPEDAEAIA